MVSTELTIAGRLREALRPLWRQLASERTLSLGKSGVLARLVEFGRATASELAAAERISPQAVTMVVRDLESLGLVLRTPDNGDRRRIWIELTETGRERLAQERSMGVGWLDRAILERLTDGERKALEQVIPILNKITREVPVD
jgi:DNA-binding MarR family transcriptional regulator